MKTLHHGQRNEIWPAAYAAYALRKGAYARHFFPCRDLPSQPYVFYPALAAGVDTKEGENRRHDGVRATKKTREGLFGLGD